MELFEYIKSQLPHLPNPAIMKNMGASEELIGYVRETVWNTNLGMMKTLGCEAGGGGDQGEVWFTSKTIGECVDDYRETELAQTSVAKPNELLANPSDYDMRLNGISLSYVQATPFSGWANADETVSVFNGGSEAPDVWGAAVPCDITDVEVTVAHK